MSDFQILCVTMNQAGFNKIQEMNIHSDVIFSNQSDTTKYETITFDDHVAQMITTDTRGVGKNRNIGLLYANADICLFADDDVIYNDKMEKQVTKEFDRYPDADIIIFHYQPTDEIRKKVITRPKQTKKIYRFSRKPWGAPCIAFRLREIKKHNLWFTTLFGGGCLFPCGEDSIWLNDAVKRGLRIYVSSETIGTIKTDKSSWFTGMNEKYFFAQGAYYKNQHPRSLYLWILYFTLRTKTLCKMKTVDKIRWMYSGSKAYNYQVGYDEYLSSMKGR